MRLSKLQQHILRQCVLRKGHVPRKEFRGAASQDVVTKSLERLIDKGLMVGYGRRTPHKWFIDEVRLMPSGRRVAQRLFGQQQHLPLNLRPKRATIKTNQPNGNSKEN